MAVLAFAIFGEDKFLLTLNSITMKKYLSGILVSLCLLTACSKDETEAGAVNPPITTAEQARAAFTKINTLWISTLKPVLTKEKQTYSGKVLEGAGGGKAVINGSFTRSSSSSSSSTRNSSIADVTITFQQYETDGLRLDGVLRFYDSYNSRTACSSSGCASSTHTYLSYSSESAAGVANPPVAIEFELNGKTFRDQILLDANKEFVTWSVKLTNENKQEFSFSY